MPSRRNSGREASRIIRQLMPDIEAEKRVRVGFKLGDLYAQGLTYLNGYEKPRRTLADRFQTPFNWAYEDRAAADPQAPSRTYI